jgi:TonB-linked SusC/RagA family outer membrane protein
MKKIFDDQRTALFELSSKKAFRFMKLACLLLLVTIFIAFGSETNLSAKGKETTALLQQITVTGTITDAATGNPLPGAAIIIQGTTTGTSTDANGRYSLPCPANATLVISFIGYQEQTIQVNNRSEINITLLEAITQLNEVVAVGYRTVEKGRLTGSVSTVSGEAIAAAPTLDIVRSLQGKMAGLKIVDMGGEPGLSDVSYLIRGKHTLGSNSPLIVINGIPRGESSLVELNPNDIASVTVLKDASAAIYGARAANGVILVETKTGEKGNAEITLNSTLGIATFSRIPKLMSSYQFCTYRNELDEGYGRPKPWTEQDLQLFKDGTDPIMHPNTDWYKDIYADYTPHIRHDISARGGTENVLYFLSGEYVHEGSQYRSGDMYYNRYQIRSNISAQVSKYVNVGFDLLGRVRLNHGPRYRSWYEITQVKPYDVATYPNGLPGYGIAGINHHVMTSDLAGWENNGYKEFESKLYGSINLDWITKGLAVNGYASYDFRLYQYEYFQNPYDVYNYNPLTKEYDNLAGYGEVRELYKEDGLNRGELYNVSLNYKRSFGEHRVSAFVAYEQNEGFSESLSAYRRDLVSPNIVELFSGSTNQWSNDGSASESGRVNYFGSVSYDFMRKYLLDFTLRRDGSYNFAKKGRWGIFPSASVGWTISEEPFMDFTRSWLDNLKIRTSLGQMGNDNVSSFQYMLKYDMSSYYIFGETPTRYDGFVQSNVPNPDITWETSTNMNVGLDAILFKQKLSMNIDYFYEWRRDILIVRNASVPTYTGLSLPAENLGKVDNQGFEYQVDFKNKAGNFWYNIGGNIAYTRSKIVYMDESKDIPEYQKREGYPLDSYLTYKTNGLFNTQAELDDPNNYKITSGGYTQTLGDVIYIDVDKSGTITSLDQYRRRTSATPEIQFGINAAVSYKGLALLAFFQGSARSEIFHRWSGIITNFNVPDYLFTERWTPENPDAKYPRAFPGAWSCNTRSSDFWIYDNSFVSLRNLNLSYDLPSKWMSKISFKGIQVYMKASNVWTIWDGISARTGKKYYSPELGAQGATYNPDYYYPQQSIVTFGLQVVL